MSVLQWIFAASLAGAVLSILCAALFAFNANTKLINSLVSYAIGALLGAVFLNMLPEAVELSDGNISMVSATVLIGILIFFTLEKLLLWRHCHHDHCEAHEGLQDHHQHQHQHEQHTQRSDVMIIVGDSFHNFVDGVIIAAAFMTDIHLGMVTALAIIAHEIPQEVGDFVILLHNGYSKTQALVVNLCCSLATMVGAILAYFALQSLQSLVPYLLSLAAASMIYVAVADLIPGLHKKVHLSDTIQQVTLIGSGIATIYLVGLLTLHQH